MPKALILGGKGFIGRHVAKNLSEKGFDVIGLGHGQWNSDDYLAYGYSSWHTGQVDIQSLKALNIRPDVIIHAAGGSSVPFSIANPHTDFMLTVKSTADLLEFSRVECPSAKIVLLSSAGVYGLVDQLPISEETICKPLSPYGVHKLMAEYLCREYASTYSLNIGIVRLFSIYGEGLRKQLLWDACNKTQRGKNLYFGTGKETRDWLHVSDAASLIAFVAEHASTQCPIFNGGVGTGVSVDELLKVLYEALDFSIPAEFSGSAREGDPMHYVADITKATSLGWQPNVDWKQGIKNYGLWFREAAGD